MGRATIQVIFSAGDSWRRFMDAMHRLQEAYIQLGTALGLPDPRAERIYRHKQSELLNHVMRMNAGNRRRQMRSKGGAL